MYFILVFFINIIVCKRKKLERCPVYTFFTDLSKFNNDFSLDSKMVKIWKRNWYKNGWLPIVLSREKSKTHPFYKIYMNRFAQLPSVNPVEYEQTCYERWIALYQVGGGVFVDYDMANLKVNELKLSYCGKRNPLTSFKEHVPMFTIGGSAYISGLLNYFASYKITASDNYNGFPHASDMTLIRKNSNIFYKNILESTSNDLIHFSHHYYGSLKSKESNLTRVEWMQQSLLIHTRQVHRIIFIQTPNSKWIDYLSNTLNVKSCDPEWLPSQLHINGKCKGILFFANDDFRKEDGDIIFNFDSNDLPRRHIPLSIENWLDSQIIIEYVLGTVLNFLEEPENTTYYINSQYYNNSKSKFNGLLSRIKKIENNFY